MSYMCSMGSESRIYTIKSGAEVTSSSGDIWPVRWALNSNALSVPLASGGSATLDSVIMAPESGVVSNVRSTIGVFAPEFCHSLGLPDFYDTNADKRTEQSCHRNTATGCITRATPLCGLSNRVDTSLTAVLRPALTARWLPEVGPVLLATGRSIRSPPARIAHTAP